MDYRKNPKSNLQPKVEQKQMLKAEIKPVAYTSKATSPKMPKTKTPKITAKNLAGPKKGIAPSKKTSKK